MGAIGDDKDARISRERTMPIGRRKGAGLMLPSAAVIYLLQAARKESALPSDSLQTQAGAQLLFIHSRISQPTSLASPAFAAAAGTLTRRRREWPDAFHHQFRHLGAPDVIVDT